MSQPVAGAFTQEQLEAIHYTGVDSCVVAVPGSGKTTVLVERFRRLVHHHGFDLRKIVAITFTEKAAANMKLRLQQIFADDPVRLRDLESAWVSTIHGFCARLLREHAIAAGVDPRFTIMDARESEQAQYDCMRRALDEFIESRHEDGLALIEALQNPIFFDRELLDAYDAIRCSGMSMAFIRGMGSPGQPPDAREAALRVCELVSLWPLKLTANQGEQRKRLLAWAQQVQESPDEVFEVTTALNLKDGIPKACENTLVPMLQSLIAGLTDRQFARFRCMVFDIFNRFEKIYAERKSAAAQLDFNDLERFTIKLLDSSPEVRRRVQSGFTQVMLDEFQDINQQQADLIDRLRAKDIFFGVGDANQSIYGFRHARPEIFAAYQEQVRSGNNQITKLSHNFRSRAQILSLVEAMLNGVQGIEARSLTAAGNFTSKDGPSIEVMKIIGANGDDATAREARWIAHRILALRGTLIIGSGDQVRKADFGDFAVLCRNGESSMRPIMAAFDKARIPYVCGKRESFLLARECRDITGFLRTIANPRDTIALATALRSRFVGMSDEGLLALRSLAGSVLSGLNRAAFDPGLLGALSNEDAVKLERFMDNLERWRAQQPVVSIELLISRILDDCGFAWTPGTIEGENIEKFLDLARTEGCRKNLSAFLREVESLKTAVNTESDLSDKDQGARVQLMTAHAAKGLEFPVTIIAGMERQTAGDTSSVSFTPQHGLGFTWRNPAGAERLRDSWMLQNRKVTSLREKDETNRLLYVAMTRAQEHLILSYASSSGARADWARLVSDFFGLSGSKPGQERRSYKGEGFEASLLTTDQDPPDLTADHIPSVTREPLLLTARPAASSQHDSTVNVTSLALYASCPRRYFIQSYVGWNGGRRAAFDPGCPPPEPDADEFGAAEIGSMVHEILAGRNEHCPDEARRLADVFSSSELGRRAAAAPISFREWDFIFDAGGTLVRGSIDLWFEDAGGIHLVDYKTDDISGADAATRAAAYTPQLALYSMALEKALGRRPGRASLHFLRPDIVVDVPLTTTEFTNVHQLLAELRQAQHSLDFPLAAGAHCRTCPFYGGFCPAE